jgi:hypothetical protein
MSDPIAKALALLEALDGPTISAIRSAVREAVLLRARVTALRDLCVELKLLHDKSESPSEALLALMICVRGARGEIDFLKREIADLRSSSRAAPAPTSDAPSPRS